MEILFLPEEASFDFFVLLVSQPYRMEICSIYLNVWRGCLDKFLSKQKKNHQERKSVGE
jgi:hypothetical protein